MLLNRDLNVSFQTSLRFQVLESPVCWEIGPCITRRNSLMTQSFVTLRDVQAEVQVLKFNLLFLAPN